MIEQINNLAQLWWGWTSAMFWQVGLLIALIALLDKLIRRWVWPQLRYALWSLILIKLVLSPTLSLPSGLAPKLRPFVTQVLDNTIDEPAVTEKLPSVFPFLTDRVNRVAAQSEQYLIATVEDIPPASYPVVGDGLIRAAGPRLDWRVYPMSVWLLGMVTLGGWMLVKLRRLRRAHPNKSGKTSLPESFHDQLARCAERLGLRRQPAVVVTDKIHTPAVFGLFRPVLLMPVGYIHNLSRKDTEYLLLHELAHIKRGDLVTHSLYIILQSAYWYNPFLWLVRRRLRHLRELCCDATVANLLRDRTVEYRRTLLEAARQFLITPVEYGLGLVGLFEDSNFLIARIKWLEKPIWRYRKMKNAAVITIVLVLLACVLPMAQGRQDAASESEGLGTGSEPTEEKSVESSEVTETEQEQSSKQEQLSKAMKALQFQLQQLELQKQKLDHELHAISHAEHSASHQAHQTTEHTAHDELKAKEAKDKAAKAADRANKAKDKSAKAKASAQVRKAKARAKDWEQWAREMEDWAAHYKTWADSDEFKQWQKDIERWAQDLAKSKLRMRAGEPGPAPEPGPMPVMPPMPSTPMPAAPAAPMPSEVALPNIMDIVDDLPMMIGTSVRAVDMAMTPSAEEVPLGKPGQDIEIKKDESGKYIATTLMHFVAKAQPGKPLIVRNKIGGINLRPSKDGTCDVRARIRGTAKSPDQARAMVEAVGMNLDSSEKRYYLAPVRHDGGKWDDLSVDLQITVPSGVLPDVMTELGSVELRDLKGHIKVATNLGGIKAVNTTGDIELVTKMGNIEFVAPKDLSAKLSVQTKMGSIKSDLPLEINRSMMFQKSAEGTVGTGQGNIRMTTDMGSIHLRWQAPAQASPGLY